jgi:hypothetical protein
MIWVFKTSVKNKTQVKKIVPLLNQRILPDGRWNIDLGDCDKVLRIEVSDLSVEELIADLENAGYVCEEMV